MKFGVRELIFVVVMLGVLGSSYFFVFSKAAVRRASIEAECDRKLKELSDVQRVRAGTADLAKQIDELQQAIDFFEKRLPQHGEVAQVLDQVTNLASKNGLEQRTFRGGKIRRAANCNEQPIELTLAGDFEGFYVYLQELERFERLVRVSKMDLLKMNERDGAMEAKLTISIFFEPEAGATATASAQ